MVKLYVYEVFFQRENGTNFFVYFTILISNCKFRVLKRLAYIFKNSDRRDAISYNVTNVVARQHKNITEF